MGEEAGIKRRATSPNGLLRESGTRWQRSGSLVREGEVVHGSLSAGQEGRKELPGIGNMMSLVGRATIAGMLFDLGEYPGLVLGGESLVFGELYRIHTESVQEFFHRLDVFERFFPDNPSESLFVRQMVHLVEPKTDAWLYVYNRDTAGSPIVTSGKWQNYRRSTMANATKNS